jgi:hypothetical protein
MVCVWVAVGAVRLHAGQFHAQDLFVQKEQGRQRLVVRAAGHLTLSGQHGQKYLYFDGSYVFGVGHCATRLRRPEHEKQTQ